MSKSEEKELRDEIAKLKETLTGDMFADMETRDRIHNLQLKLDGSPEIDKKNYICKRLIQNG